MTNKEAAEIIKIARAEVEWEYPMDYAAAFDKAIEALKQEPKWIPVSERLPEEREWVGTKRFGTTKSDEVYVTFECPDGNRFTEHLMFQNGKVPPHEQRKIEAFNRGAVPIAWMPLPEPYRAESEE